MDDKYRVRTDFYVYTHSCRDTGVVFYVGKGTGKRAHDFNMRSQAWREYVNELPNCYDVNIIAKGQTEHEAYSLENDLISQYGKQIEGRGSLVNVTDGGHVIFGEGPKVELSLPLSQTAVSYEEALYKARRYQTLSVKEADVLSMKLEAVGDSFNRKVDAIWWEPEDGSRDDGPETDFEFAVEGAIDSICQFCNALKNRTDSDHDLFFEFDDTLGDLLSEIEDIILCHSNPHLILGRLFTVADQDKLYLTNEYVDLSEKNSDLDAVLDLSVEILIAGWEIVKTYKRSCHPDDWNVHHF